MTYKVFFRKISHRLGFGMSADKQPVLAKPAAWAFLRSAPSGIPLSHRGPSVCLEIAAEALEAQRIPFLVIGGALLGGFRAHNIAGRPSDVDLVVRQTDYLSAIGAIVGGKVRHSLVVRARFTSRAPNSACSIKFFARAVTVGYIDLHSARPVGNHDSPHSWVIPGPEKSKPVPMSLQVPISGSSFRVPASVTIYNRTYPAPQETAEFLRRCYGDDFMIPTGR